MKYKVEESNSYLKVFETPMEAIHYASRKLYIAEKYGSPESIVEQLKNGFAFNYTYGWEEMRIIPVKPGDL